MIFSRLASGLLIVTLLSWLSGCSQGLPPEQARARAQKLLETIQAGAIDDALSMYGDEFFGAHSREQWRLELQRMNERVGPIESFVLRKESYDSRYSARFYMFEYQTLHPKGKTWQTLTVINPVGTEELKIVGHMIKYPQTGG